MGGQGAVKAGGWRRFKFSPTSHLNKGMPMLMPVVLYFKLMGPVMQKQLRQSGSLFLGLQQLPVKGL